VGSIPTAPPIYLSDGWTLNKNIRGQKGQIKRMTGYVFLFSGTGDNRMRQFQRSTDISLNHVFSSQLALAPSGGSLFLIISELPPTRPEQLEELE
jgi:hypothetical protein